MRLIDTKTLALCTFHEPDIPSYAILSHTWTDSEVTLQEFRSKTSTEKLGYDKITDFCRLCAQRNIAWAWVDTCCIDKTNSAELSEAINSMYTWYRRSSICIAYLYDLSDISGTSEATWADKFHNSAWFTRGWTLQELLAPKNVEFYSRQWVLLGDKISLQNFVSEATGVDASYLVTGKNIGLACIAEKMSWASKRHTTRAEDQAYCLLGLFRVNMPLLYGEGGARAFLRLQEEIIKISADHSIFAWFANEEAFGENSSVLKHCSSGLLAPSPNFFASSYGIRRRIHKNRTDRRWLEGSSPNPFQMTNRGLQIQLPVTEWKCEDARCVADATRCRLAILDCYFKGIQERSIVLHIRSQEFTLYSDGEMWQYSDGDVERVHLDKKTTVSEQIEWNETLFVRRGIPSRVDSSDRGTKIQRGVFFSRDELLRN